MVPQRNLLTMRALYMVCLEQVAECWSNTASTASCVRQGLGASDKDATASRTLPNLQYTKRSIKKKGSWPASQYCHQGHKDLDDSADCRQHAKGSPAAARQYGARSVMPHQVYRSGPTGLWWGHIPGGLRPAIDNIYYIIDNMP